tara:strand:+ start:424 stop:849 length:426 start_codon:yes stop_codon:yes gene_type:complete
MTKFIPFVFLLIYSSTSVAELYEVRISSRLDPNAIIITEVDIIFVYDNDIVNNFPKSKSSWYSGKRRFTSSAGDKVDVVNIFIPQGFDSVSPTLPARKAEARKVFVFAYHDDAQASPVDLTDMSAVLIEIDPFGIVASPLN